MQLALSFTTLLASVLVLLSATGNGVEAAPAKRSRSVTLPLTRLHQNRADVHPQIVSASLVSGARVAQVLTRSEQLLQQHINRSVKRYARMKGRAPPTKREMSDKIVKRFNRKNDKASAAVEAFQDFVGSLSASTATAHKDATKAKGHGKHGKGGAAAGASNSTATGTASASNSTSTDDGTDASNSTASGLTDANTPTTANSLGLDIE